MSGVALAKARKHPLIQHSRLSKAIIISFWAKLFGMMHIKTILKPSHDLFCATCPASYLTGSLPDKLKKGINQIPKMAV